MALLQLPELEGVVWEVMWVLSFGSGGIFGRVEASFS